MRGGKILEIARGSFFVGLKKWSRWERQKGRRVSLEIKIAAKRWSGAKRQRRNHRARVGVRKVNFKRLIEPEQEWGRDKIINERKGLLKRGIRREGRRRGERRNVFWKFVLKSFPIVVHLSKMTKIVSKVGEQKKKRPWKKLKEDWKSLEPPKHIAKKIERSQVWAK